MKIRIKNIIFNFFAIVTVIAVGFIGFNLISGARGYAVTSPSMKDELNVGDIVFVRAVVFEDLKVGDVITVASSDSQSYFTHRVVGIDADKRTVTTRGDANTADDPMPTDAERIVGRMWYSVPLLGFIPIALSTAANRYTGLVIIALVSAALVIINTVLPKILSKKKRGDNDE